MLACLEKPAWRAYFSPTFPGLIEACFLDLKNAVHGEWDPLQPYSESIPPCGKDL